MYLLSQRGEQNPSAISRRKTLPSGILNKNAVYRLGFLPPTLGTKVRILYLKRQFESAALVKEGTFPCRKTRQMISTNPSLSRTSSSLCKQSRCAGVCVPD